MSVRESAPELYRAVSHLSHATGKTSLDPILVHLVKLRASQINHCAYCVELHTREALEDGIDPRKIYLLTVWEESHLFDTRERAALAWTESVTLIAKTGVPDDAFAAVRAVFSQTEVAELTVVIATINVWNRISVSSRTPHD
jgi:AhpD family alkylhydroperoxidase